MRCPGDLQSTLSGKPLQYVEVCIGVEPLPAACIEVSFPLEECTWPMTMLYEESATLLWTQRP